MGKYVTQNVRRDESIIQDAENSMVCVVVSWVWGILGCFLLFIPTIKAIKATITFFTTELSLTSKRVIGKVGLINTKAMDATLNKVQNVSVSSGLFGKIFHYGTIRISTAAGDFVFSDMKNPDALKGMIMNQIEVYEEERLQSQAAQMANAIRGNV